MAISLAHPSGEEGEHFTCLNKRFLPSRRQEIGGGGGGKHPVWGKVSKVGLARFSLFLFSCNSCFMGDGYLANDRGVVLVHTKLYRYKVPNHKVPSHRVSNYKVPNLGINLFIMNFFV
jgi:hypothetical protein